MDFNRPRIELTNSATDSRVEFICKVLAAIIWILSCYAMFNMPQTIPLHFNSNGQPDSYGDKKTIFILPLLGTLLYWGLTQLNKFPHLFNYTTRITAENAHSQYSMATRVLRFLKLSILLIFALIIIMIYLSATGVVNGLSLWFLPVILAVLLVPTIVLVIQSLKK